MTILSLLLLLQAGQAPVGGSLRETFQPYGRCLTEQGRPLATKDRSDSEILGHAAQDCVSARRASEAAASLALAERGATLEQALERSARLREDTERTAIAILRASPDGLQDRVAIPRVRRTLDIPDEIAPAVLPYFLCRSASAGVPVYAEGKTSPVSPSSDVAPGGSCDAQRLNAAADADAMLRRRDGRAETAHRSLIETTLAGIDVFLRNAASSTQDDVDDED